jgi:UDP-glucuronate decarboxylase
MATARAYYSAPRNILIAGGAGFIGSHLCETLLLKGHRIYCVDNLQTGSLENLRVLQRESRFHFIEQDICSPLPASMKVQQIYNLACAASPPQYQIDPVHTMMTSVLGTKNLLDHAAACSARFLQASTSEVYGDPEQHPQCESYRGNVNPVGPRACYDEGKRSAETLCFDYRRLKLADARVVRIFNTYGPRMHPDDGRIISNFAVQALLHHPITVYGTGEQTRSFCYVDDTIAGLLSMMEIERPPSAPINLGNPEEYSVLYIARLIGKLAGVTVSIVHKPLPEDDPKRRRPDITFAESILGWKPRIKLSRGLPPTIEWFARCIQQNSLPQAHSDDLHASL